MIIPRAPGRITNGQVQELVMIKRVLNADAKMFEKDILDLTRTVQHAVAGAATAFLTDDDTVAVEVLRNAGAIRVRCYEIEGSIVRLMAGAGAQGGASRQLAGFVHVVSALRRAAECTGKLGRIQLDPAGGRIRATLGVIDRLASQAARLLGRSAEAFLALDPREAGTLRSDRSEVNDAYLRLNDEMLEVAAHNPSCIGAANSMLWFAHLLDAIAERALDICEQTFLLSGIEMGTEGEALNELAFQVHAMN
jgi:phosphate uptake regulator